MLVRLSGKARWAISCATAAAAVALAACAVDEPSAGPSPTPSAEVAGVEVDFCELIDLDEVHEVAADWGGEEQANAGELRVTWRTVSTAFNQSVTGESEHCGYGYGTETSAGFDLEVWPGGRENRDGGLAEDFFNADGNIFYLGVNAGDGFLVLRYSYPNLFGTSPPATEVEQGMNRLLRPMTELVPPDAVLPRLDAGDGCAAIEEAAATAIAGPPEYSRYSDLDGGSFHCHFATSATPAEVSVSLHRGSAEFFRQDLSPPFWTELDYLEDAWIYDSQSPSIRVFASEDVVRVQFGLVGAERDADQVAEELTTEMVPILTDG